MREKSGYELRERYSAVVEYWKAKLFKERGKLAEYLVVVEMEAQLPFGSVLLRRISECCISFRKFRGRSLAIHIDKARAQLFDCFTIVPGLSLPPIRAISPTSSK